MLGLHQPHLVIHGHRIVVDRPDLQGHGSGTGAALVVRHLVREGVGSMEVGIRHIGERAVRVELEGAVGGPLHRGRNDDHRVAVFIRVHAIAVVGEHVAEHVVLVRGEDCFSAGKNVCVSFASPSYIHVPSCS